MDNRLDELAKALAGGMSRREALWRLAGGLTGALLASLGLENAWGFKAKAKIDKDRCGHFCNKHLKGFKHKSPQFQECLVGCRWCVEVGVVPCGVSSDLRVICCTPDAICCDAECCDPDNEVCCPDGCADLMSDPLNCGKCGHECPNLEEVDCVDGECRGRT